MDKLREKDIAKLSNITDISIYELTKLSAMSLLDKATTMDVLVMYDWKVLKQTKKYTVGQIVQALMDEYQISRTRVQSAIYQKKKKGHYCSQCGKRSTKHLLDKNNGLCDRCVVRSIEL